jgi:hypothetical protein
MLFVLISDTKSVQGDQRNTTREFVNATHPATASCAKRIHTPGVAGSQSNTGSDMCRMQRTANGATVNCTAVQLHLAQVAGVDALLC